jgi:hypothetical protein
MQPCNQRARALGFIREGQRRSATLIQRRLRCVAGRSSLVPFRLLTSRRFSLHLVGRLVLSKANVNRVSQEVVRRPGQIGYLDNKLRLDPMDAREHEGRAETGFARRQDVQRRGFCGLAGPGGAADRQAPYRHPRADAAGVNELAGVVIVSRQERPEMRPRAFGV